MFIIAGIVGAIVALFIGRWAYRHVDHIRAYRDHLETAMRENERD